MPHPLDGIEANGRYILGEHGEPELCPDLLKWGEFMQRANRHVGETFLSDGTRVSTIFLGLDQSHARYMGSSSHEPILFETMVFPHPDAAALDDGRGESIDQDRYCTWDEAEKGHAAMVARREGRLAATMARLQELAKPALAQREERGQQAHPEHGEADLAGLDLGRRGGAEDDEADDADGGGGGDVDGHG